MSTKKYVSLSKLSAFLDNLKNIFASKTHTHKMSDITDYTSHDDVYTKTEVDVAIAAAITAVLNLTFTIDNITYAAEKGMTWYEWVRSIYAPEGYSCESTESKVYATSNSYIVDTSGNAVIGSTPIYKGIGYKSEETYTEEANATGTTVVINSFAEEANEFGTTVII